MYMTIAQHAIYYTNVKPYKNLFLKTCTIQGLPPQLELLAVFSCKSGNDNMSEQCNHICPYRKYEYTVSPRHGHTDTDYICIHFPFFESCHIWICTKKSGQSCTCYNDQPNCISAFLDINTIKNAVIMTCTHAGCRNTVARVQSRQKRIHLSTNSVRFWRQQLL